MHDFLKFSDLDKLSYVKKANYLEIFLDSKKNVGFDQFIIDLVSDTFWSSRKNSNVKYKDLILGLSKFISNTNSIEPSYHNQDHFKDVCLSISLLLRAQTEIASSLDQAASWKVSDQEAWSLLLCGVCHDLGHDGSVNKHPFELEKRSIELVQEFLEKSSLTLFERKEIIGTIEPIILATDPRYLPTLLHKFITGNNLQRSDYLSMLMVEADLLASTLPNKGKILSERLSEEWRLTNPDASVSVKTKKGRLYFLEHIRFISPHSSVLGMESIRQLSINELKE
jgi:hypothetical protein